MTQTPVWRLIAEQEVRSKLRDKAFLGGLAFSVGGLIVLIAVVSFLGGRPDTYEVAVVGPDAKSVVQAADADLDQMPGSDVSASARGFDTVELAEQAVQDGDVDAALVQRAQGFVVIGDEAVETKLRAALSTAVSSTTVAQNAERQGVDLDKLRAGTTLDERLLDPNAEQNDGRSAVALAFAVVFLMTALGFGMMIAQSVVREKESRVVEILAAAVPIRAMLWGKILGNSALALGQVVLMVAVGFVGLYATGRTELLSGVGPAMLWYIAFFVLGFLALASLWSVAGSLATRQEDLQSTTLPGQLILLGPYLLSVLGNDTTQAVMSMLPIVSTMTMPGRMAQGAVPGWQIGVAIALTVAAAYVFVRIGTRLYERSLLQTGRKMGYREALRAEPR